jgi:hypothetical protein
MDSWYEKERQFFSNFRSTYKQPASIEELKAYTQKYNKLLCSYKQHWSTVKNLAEDVSNKMGVDGFVSRIHHP